MSKEQNVHYLFSGSGLSESRVTVYHDDWLVVNARLPKTNIAPKAGGFQ